MADNIINKFLQLNDPNIARQTRNMSYFDAIKSEIPGTKSYKGYNPFYKGADKTGLRGYVNQGIKSLGGSFQQGSNVGGATPLTRKLAQDATRVGSKVANLGRFALSSPFGTASAVGTGIGYGVDQLAQALNTPEEYEAMKEAARAQRGFGYFDDIDISQPPGTNVGIMSNLDNLFGFNKAMAEESMVNVDNVKSAINAARNREALNRQGLMALDDAGLISDPYETFTQVAKPGFNKQFAKQLGSTALSFITKNPLVALFTKGLGALAGRGGFTGVRGGQNLYGDTTFNTFGKSTSLADFFQRLRDKKAREAAAARGSVKELQSRIDRGDFDGDNPEDAPGGAASNQDAGRTGQYG